MATSKKETGKPTPENTAQNTAQNTAETNEKNIHTLAEKISGIRVAMLTTVDTDGVLRSRPMATQELEFDGRLWFFTSNQSGKVHSIEKDQHVNVSYASIDDNRYVSIAGTARVMRDDQKIKELWSPMLKAWFPKGPQDPEISLICVDVQSAEYWDSPSSTFVRLVGFAKAVATGKRYEPGEHQRMDIQTH